METIKGNGITLKPFRSGLELPLGKWIDDLIKGKTLKKDSELAMEIKGKMEEVVRELAKPDLNLAPDWKDISINDTSKIVGHKKPQGEDREGYWQKVSASPYIRGNLVTIYDGIPGGQDHAVMQVGLDKNGELVEDITVQRFGPTPTIDEPGDKRIVPVTPE